LPSATSIRSVGRPACNAFPCHSSHVTAAPLSPFPNFQFSFFHVNETRFPSSLLPLTSVVATTAAAGCYYSRALSQLSNPNAVVIKPQGALGGYLYSIF